MQAAYAYCYNWLTWRTQEKLREKGSHRRWRRGGFGGIRAALELAKEDITDVVLVSERPDYYYFPTPYHTATGGSEAHSSIPLEDLFADKFIKLVIAKATGIDNVNKQLPLENGEPHAYDILILLCLNSKVEGVSA